MTTLRTLFMLVALGMALPMNAAKYKIRNATGENLYLMVVPRGGVCNSTVVNPFKPGEIKEEDKGLCDIEYIKIFRITPGRPVNDDDLIAKRNFDGNITHSYSLQVIKK